jgi:hypothetical protein
MAAGADLGANKLLAGHLATRAKIGKAVRLSAWLQWAESESRNEEQ